MISKATRDKAIYIRINASEDKRLKEYARQEKMSVSAFVRLAIDELIKNRRLIRYDEKIQS